MKRILSLILASLLLCGCMESVRLDDRAIVRAIAIDRVDDSYNITLQISQTTNQSLGGEGSKNLLSTETGATLTEAFAKATLTQGKQLFLGNCALLLIGQATARGGIKDILHYLNALNRINPSLTVALTEHDAAEILRAWEENPLLSADAINDRLESAWKSGFAVRGRLLDTLGTLQNEQVAACLPLLSLSRGEQAQKPAAQTDSIALPAAAGASSSAPAGTPLSEELPRLRIAGAGVFRGEYLDRLINERAVRGYLWTQNRIQATSLSVSDDRLGKVSAVTVKQKAHISVEPVGDLLVCSIELDVRGAVLEEKLEHAEEFSGEERALAVMLQERALQEEIEWMISETQKKGYDLLGLSLLVRQRLPAYYAQNKSRWSEVARDSGYNVQVRCTLDGAGVAQTVAKN